MFPLVILIVLLQASVQVTDARNTTNSFRNDNPQSPSTSSPSATKGVGDFVAAGLQMQTEGTSTSTSTSATQGDSSMTSLSRLNATTTSPTLPSTDMGGNGTIAPSAASCQSASDSYASASLSWNKQNHPTTITTVQIASETDNFTIIDTSQTAYITLCDQVPRGLGPAIHITSFSPSTFDGTWTRTFTEQAGPPFPKPTCNISASDCNLLINSFSSMVSATPALLEDGDLVYFRPSCTTTYSSAGTTCNPAECIIAPPVFSTFGQTTAGVRLLYWPVTRIGDVCDGTATKTGTATGEGPNTYADKDVIGDLTITSPTVAISFDILSRSDGCGTTLSNVVFLMDPNSVSSQRGARAEEEWFTFNYADLNTKCVSSGGVSGCYTDVPSSAYFGQPKCGVGPAETSGTSAWCAQTIYNDYAPQLGVPWGLSDIEPSWGTTCLPNPLGGWDPPLALSTVALLDGPKATPAETTTAHNAPTALPESKPTSTPSKTGGGGGGDPKHTAAGESNGLAGAIAGAVGQGQSKSWGDPSPTKADPPAGADPTEAADPPPRASDGGDPSDPPTSGIGSGSSEDPWGNDSSGWNEGLDNSPHSPTTIAILGAPSAGADPSNSGVIAGITGLPVVVSSGVVLVGGSTLSAGEQATVDGTVLSAGSSDIVVGSSTIAIPPLATPEFTSQIGSEAVEIISGHVVVDGSTLSPGQQITIDGTVVSAGSTQAVVGSSTISIAPTDPAGSGTNADASVPSQFTGAAAHARHGHRLVSAVLSISCLIFSLL